MGRGPSVPGRRAVARGTRDHSCPWLYHCRPAGGKTEEMGSRPNSRALRDIINTLPATQWKGPEGRHEGSRG